MKYIDTHCHLNTDDYDFDLKEVIDRAKEKEVGMIVVGTNLKTSEKAIQISEENEDIWAVIGLHPTDIPCEIGNGKFDFDRYRKMAENKKVVAIGECGLDYFRNKSELEKDINTEIQREVFEKQIKIANEVNKPLMLHLRNSIDRKQNAYTD
ncbi:MAG: TatD family hydrolase, partial [Patescibacteria group bacterium]